MRRREFVTLLGGAAAWPLGAAQAQADRVRVIGVIMALSSNDAEAQGRLAAFRQTLQNSGWTVDGNLRIEYRWGFGDSDRGRRTLPN